MKAGGWPTEAGDLATRRRIAARGLKKSRLRGDRSDGDENKPPSGTGDRTGQPKSSRRVHRTGEGDKRRKRTRRRDNTSKDKTRRQGRQTKGGKKAENKGGAGSRRKRRESRHENHPPGRRPRHRPGAAAPTAPQRNAAAKKNQPTPKADPLDDAKKQARSRGRVGGGAARTAMFFRCFWSAPGHKPRPHRSPALVFFR
jgi:hypothetical protein